jgi:hypothetical protein
MFALLLVIAAALILTGRCIWELVFLREPLFQRYRNNGIWTLFALLCSIVCILLGAEVFPFRGSPYAAWAGAGGLAAYWLSFFAKAYLPRIVNSLLRLLMAAGMACCAYLVYLMRADFRDEQLYITGIVILVPAIQSMLLLTELLFNAAWSAGGRRITWFVLLELGLAVFLLLPLTLESATHATQLVTTG